MQFKVFLNRTTWGWKFQNATSRVFIRSQPNYIIALLNMETFFLPFLGYRKKN